MITNRFLVFIFCYFLVRGQSGYRAGTERGAGRRRTRSTMSSLKFENKKTNFCWIRWGGISSGGQSPLGPIADCRGSLSKTPKGPYTPTRSVVRLSGKLSDLSQFGVVRSAVVNAVGDLFKPSVIFSNRLWSFQAICVLFSWFHMLNRPWLNRSVGGVLSLDWTRGPEVRLVNKAGKQWRSRWWCGIRRSRGPIR